MFAWFSSQILDVRHDKRREIEWREGGWEGGRKGGRETKKRKNEVNKDKEGKSKGGIDKQRKRENQRTKTMREVEWHGIVVSIVAYCVNQVSGTNPGGEYIFSLFRPGNFFQKPYK